jgi:O-succinylhomoserine sulfhydrylase
MFQGRLAALEAPRRAWRRRPAWRQVTTLTLGLLKSGDHIISARGVFGTVVPLFDQILAKFGITTTWVDLQDLDQWRKAVRPNTELLFVETPSNPVCEIADIAALAEIAKKAGAVLAVDNAVCSPALQRPIEHGADLVVHSATKYLEGQGRVLAGAICGRAELVSGPLFGFVRTAGPAISPFNAWIVLKGMETLRIRMKAQSENALADRALARAAAGRRARELSGPGVASRSTRSRCGSNPRAEPVLSFVLKGGRAAAWRVIDAVKLISITANFGDVKTTICPSATTTHARVPGGGARGLGHRRGAGAAGDRPRGRGRHPGRLARGL